MNTFRPALKHFALLFMALTPLMPTLAFSERLRPDELLDRIQAAYEEPSRLHRTTRTKVLTEYAEQPQERERFEMTLDFFVDEERMAARGTSTNWKGADEAERRDSFFQRIWDGSRDLTFQETRTGIAQGLWLGNTSTDSGEVDRLRSFYTGAELAGIFHGDFQPFYEIVRGASDLKVKMDKKAFPDTPTYRLEATTERGHYTVWVETTSGYLIRKAVVRRTAEDLIWRDDRLSELRHLPKESMEYVITVDSFREIDGRRIPMNGRATIDSIFRGRGPGRSRSSRSVWDIQIEHVSFAPDFEELAAFEVDAPDGTPVMAFDEEGRGAPKAVWTRDGLVFDDELAQKAWSAQRTQMDAQASLMKLPDIYDEHAEGQELLVAALADAKRDGKRVLVVWGANWCGWCRGLEEICNRSPEIVAILDSSFVVVHIDVGRNDKNLDLGRELGVEVAQLRIPQAMVLDNLGAPVAQSRSAALVVPGMGGRFVYSAELIARFLERNVR